MPDFWPEQFGHESLTPPIVLLKEQAKALAAKTKGLVLAEVISTKKGQQFTHRFVLVVPTLDNYTFELFEVEHPVLLYPANINATVIERSWEIADPDQLRAALQTVLSSPQTSRVVRALLAQASVLETAEM